MVRFLKHYAKRYFAINPPHDTLLGSQLTYPAVPATLKQLWKMSFISVSAYSDQG